MSREAADLNQSVLIAQSVAEVWKPEGRRGLNSALTPTALQQTVTPRTDEEGARNRYVMEFDKNGSSEKNTPAGSGDERTSEKSLYSSAFGG